MTRRMAVAGVVVGRDEELERLSRFVGNLDALPGVLLLEGGAGIGKTTLWRAGLAAAESAGFLVLRSTPSEAETHLAFAAAADLLAPVADDALARLPNVQRRALAGGLLLQSDDAAIDRRAVATAFLGAVRALASTRPPGGGRIDSALRPQWTISHEITEFEFHISPARSSSRPHTGVGTDGMRSRTRCARPGSLVRRSGLSTASETSGITPSRQQRSS
jgi:hypothetical protein